MQKKKNILLLILWVTLLAITIAVGIYRPETNRLDIDKDHFALKAKVNNLDKITVTNETKEIILQKSGRQWTLNESLTADPSKINDLLGILSEVSVRREVAKTVQTSLSTGSTNKYQVSLYSGDLKINTFEVAENDKGTLTYFIKDIAYVVNIPGYNFHIADIFSLTSSDWRSPYVFASNWNTLEKMKISHPANPDSNFEIVYDNLGYTMSTNHALDTARMYDYMQQVSFLQVVSFLDAKDSLKRTRTPDLNIIVEDVGGQQMKLDFYMSDDQTIGQINNQEWAIFDPNQVVNLVKNTQDFELKN